MHSQMNQVHDTTKNNTIRLNDGPNDIITDVIMNNNYGQLQFDSQPNPSLFPPLPELINNKRTLVKHDDNNNYKPPHVKKRKLNANNIHNESNTLIESNQSYKKDDKKDDKNVFPTITNTKTIKMEPVKFEDSYDQSVTCHICKKHFTDIYKYKLHLEKHYNNSSKKTWKHCDFDNCNKTFSNDFRFISHLASHTGDKPYKCSIIINGIKCKASNGHRNDFRKHWRSHFETKFYSKKNINDDWYIKFESSYHVSVNCYICKKHFDSFDKYRYHIKKHYIESECDNGNKRWRQCNFGCKINPKRPLYVDDASFLSHISTHTSAKPFKCDVIINGKKCQSTYGSHTKLKEHWERHFKKTVTVYSKTKTEDAILFENSYHISVNCYICQQHFSKYNEYKVHIKNHYIVDQNKTWRRCNFGCKIDPKKPLCKDDAYFISHIGTHTKNKLFKCDVVTNGKKCQSAYGSKSNLRGHWASHFKTKRKPKLKKKCQKVKREKNCLLKSEKCDNSSIQTIRNKRYKQVESEYAIFENCYHISVDCYLCKKTFDDFYQYKEHMKHHYFTDKSKTWRQCNFGCSYNPAQPLFSSDASFISHIGTHTQFKPFACDVVVNGCKCRGMYGSKRSLQEHWAVHLTTIESKIKCRKVKSEENGYCGSSLKDRKLR